MEALMLNHPAHTGSLPPGGATAAMQILEHHQLFAAAHLGQVRGTDHPNIR